MVPLPQYIGPTTYSQSAWWLSEGCSLPTFPQAIVWGAQRYPSWWCHTPTEHKMPHGSMRMWLRETVHRQPMKRKLAIPMLSLHSTLEERLASRRLDLTFHIPQLSAWARSALMWTQLLHSWHIVHVLHSDAVNIVSGWKLLYLEYYSSDSMFQWNMQYMYIQPLLWSLNSPNISAVCCKYSTLE